MRPSASVPAALVFVGACLATGARADPIQDIINRVTLVRYQSYLRVLTGVDPVPGTPGTHLANRWSHGPDITIAAQWIRDEFTAYGLDASFHTFNPTYGPNVIGELRGTTRPDDIYIVCAHYDTYHASNQLLAPGCDDNGSGSAAVLTAAWILSQYEFEATIRFITFAGEEQWMVGSQAYAAAARAANENIVGAINLDMILHPSFDNMQPDPDHDLDIGANSASQWLAQAVTGHLGTYTALDYQVHVDPSSGSDQWSFWQYGYDAVGLLENTGNEIWGGSNNSYHQLIDVLPNPHFEWDFGLATVRGAIASLIGLAGLVSSPCYADCDTSTGVGVLDIFDFLCFQNAFVTGCLWHRASDWVPGGAHGTTLGNPSPDPQGRPVWSYEWTTGGSRRSTNPWYAQATQRSTWDEDWFGTGQGAWSQGDDVNPPIFRNRMTHNIAAASWTDIPIVRWLNPAGNGAEVDLAGSVTVRWSGEGGVGSPVDVDVVIAMNDASLGAWDVLFAATVSKPIPQPTIGDEIILPVSLGGITLDERDSIVISHRAMSDSGPAGRWVILLDDVTITGPALGCYADCDGNGTLDIFDFLCFQTAFVAGCP